jgi:TIR domain-containing protein
MPQVFISHAEEDQCVAVEVAGALEHAGFSAWYYERDSVPGPPYLDQVYKAVDQCQALPRPPEGPLRRTGSAADRWLDQKAQGGVATRLRIARFTPSRDD